MLLRLGFDLGAANRAWLRAFRARVLLLTAAAARWLRLFTAARFRLFAAAWFRLRAARLGFFTAARLGLFAAAWFGFRAAGLRFFAAAGLRFGAAFRVGLSKMLILSQVFLEGFEALNLRGNDSLDLLELLNVFGLKFVLELDGVDAGYSDGCQEQKRFHCLILL